MYNWFTINDQDNVIEFDEVQTFLTQFDLFNTIYQDKIDKISKPSFNFSNPVYDKGSQNRSIKRMAAAAFELDIDGSFPVDIGVPFANSGSKMAYFSSAPSGLIDVSLNFNDFAGSFGRFSILFYLTGEVTRISNDKAVLTVDKMYYRLNDRFDFNQEEAFLIEMTIGDQPLGEWGFDPFSPELPSIGTDLTNADFRNFRNRYSVGIDFSIITNYVEIITPLFNTVEIELNSDFEKYKVEKDEYEFTDFTVK